MCVPVPVHSYKSIEGLRRETLRHHSGGVGVRRQLCGVAYLFLLLCGFQRSHGADRLSQEGPLPAGSPCFGCVSMIILTSCVSLTWVLATSDLLLEGSELIEKK